MAYVDVNTPVISQITLPSGNSYYIADREIRDVVQALSETIAGGVNFSIVWGASDYASTTAPTTAKRATIPEGVTVYYNNGASSSTGTLEASADTKGTFILIYSKTQSGNIDYYDEYATITSGATYSWEKLGDTIIELSDVVTDVTLNKQTTNFVTGLGTPSKRSVLGSSALPQANSPGVSLSTGATAGTGVISVATDASGTSTYLGATASGANVAWNSKDSVTAVTGVTATKKYFVTTSVTGVQDSTTTASKATAGTSQTTATGGSTVSSTNTDWLKGVSVTNEVLTIGAATLNTQSTPQYTFSDVTVPIKYSTPTKVATGKVTDAPKFDEDEIVTDISISGTDTVIGTDSTFTVTQPTVALASNSSSATGRVSVVTDVSATKTNVKASLGSIKITWENQDLVDAVTDPGTPSTAAGLNNNTTVTVTKGS